MEKVINVQATRRGGSDEVWRGHGVAERSRLACAALRFIRIGYEVVVTCPWPTDDVTHSVTRSTIPEISGHRLVHLATEVFWDENYGKKLVERIICHFFIHDIIRMLFKLNTQRY